jgi:molybdenum cofactor biosynthesis protein MoaC
MHDITHHTSKLQKASAVGILFCSAETVKTFQGNRFSAESLFEVARAAGFLGAKATPQLLPSCHAAGIDSLELSFEFLQREQHQALFPEEVLQRSGIIISGEAKTVGRAGIEMQVLTAVSVAALELFQKLKTLDAQLEIGGIKLLESKASKRNKNKYFATPPTCAVLVCSDAKAAGQREDTSGQLIKQMLENEKTTVSHYIVLPDCKEQIQQQIKAWVAEDVHFIFTTGGTGLGPKDKTVAAVEELLERKAEGIAEAMRHFGQMRTPLAMMSRGVAGAIGNTLVVTLPGSTNGARESLEAILPAVFHARKMLKSSGY